MSTASYFKAANLRTLRQVAMAVLVAAVFASLFIVKNVELLFGFIAILAACSLPFFSWARHGAVSIPILPAVALVYILNYAVPVLTGNFENYTPYEVMRGALTVALFLLMAFLSWRMLVFARPLERLSVDRGLTLDSTLLRSIFCALLMGLVFNAGNILNSWGWLGTWSGTFKSFGITATSGGCYLFGIALGRRNLSMAQRYLGYALVSSVILMEITTLFMNMAITYLLAIFLGYVTSAYRLPWLALSIGLAVASILNLGKGDMRSQYWISGTEDLKEISILEAPSLIANWLELGIERLASGNNEGEQTFIDRASQLSTLLLAQQQTPENIAFLDGETYANFSRMLIPRFLSPGKITSQDNLNLLSVHYGLQTDLDTRTTTLAWGMVPEAYANFGYTGIILAGLAFGLLIGGLTWLTAGAPPISLRGLVGISSLVTIVSSTGYDFSYSLLNLVQSIISILIFYGVINMFSPPSEQYSDRVVRA